MPQKLKWRSAKARPFVRAMEDALRGGEWINIFEADFDGRDFDWKAFQESNGDWVKYFSLKQMRENLTNFIKKQRELNMDAANEATDLNTNGRSLGGVNLNATEEAEEAEEEDEEEDPTVVQFPHSKNYHGDIFSTDCRCSIVANIPHGELYSYIEDREVVMDVVADPTLYNAQELVRIFGGAIYSVETAGLLESYNRNGRAYFENEKDRANLRNVVITGRIKVDFDMQQNFVAIGNLPPIFDWISPTGNRFVMLNVMKKQENNHVHNAHLFSSPIHQQSQLLYQQQQQLANKQQPVNHHHYQQQQQQQKQQQQQQQVYHQGQQQYQSPVQVTNPPMFQVPPSNMFAFAPAPVPQALTPQHSNMQQQQVFSPPHQQVFSPPQQQVFPSQQQSFTQHAPPKGPPPQHLQFSSQAVHNGHMPTPGVPVAAGLTRDMSMSEYTEETYTSEPRPASAPIATRATRPTVETVQEGENEEATQVSPKETPQKVKGGVFRAAQDAVEYATSYFKSPSDGDSNASSHMQRPPRKYYGATSENHTASTAASTTRTSIPMVSQASTPSL